MFGSKEPGKRKSRETWSRIKLDEVKTRLCWVAGRMIGTWVHNTPISKPCYFDMTDEDLECDRCRFCGPSKWQGYLPIYGDDGKPLFAIVPKHLKPQVDLLHLHQQVRVRKGNDKFDTTIVEPVKGGDHYRPGSSDRRFSADLLPFLIFTLWKSELPLVDYVMKEGRLQPTEPLAPAPEPAKTQPVAPSPNYVRKGGLADQFNQRVQADTTGLPPTVGEVLPKTNGYHPKKS